MKIAFIRKKYTPFGGAERYLSRLIDELSYQGHEVHILAQKWGKEPMGNTQAYFHQIKVISTLSFMESLTFAIGASRVAQKEEFDVIHSFDRTFFQDVYRAGDGCHREWLRQRKKIDPWYKKGTYYVSPHHLVILFLEWRLFNSPRLQYVIANSQRGKKEIIHYYGVAEAKIKVIYNGVDLHRFYPPLLLQNRRAWREKWGIEKDEVLFLFIGSGFERKGLPFLLKALSSLDKKNVKLLVAGKDKISKYKKLAHQLGIEERVRFVGPQKEVEPIYGAGDFFVLPSVYEPFSNACVEALASGLPVITTKINGIAELIKEGENGLLISDPTDIGEIADKIEKALKIWGEGNYREKILQISPLVTMESNVQDLLKIYEEVASCKRAKVG